MSPAEQTGQSPTDPTSPPPPPAPKPRTHQHGQSYYAKKTTILFVLILGMVLVAGGSALTWWGTVSEVKDMLIIGPGCVIIGTGFIIAALIFSGRAFYFRIKEGKPFKKKVEPVIRSVSTLETTDTAPLYQTYETPTSKLTNIRPPSGDLLYGDHLRRASVKASALINMLPPQSPFAVESCTTTSTNVDSMDINASIPGSPDQVVAPPVVALPKSVGDPQTVTKATFYVPVDSPSHTPTSPSRSQSSLTAVENVNGTSDSVPDTSSSRGASPHVASGGVPHAGQENTDRTEHSTKEITHEPDPRVDSGLGTPDNGLET